MDTTVLQLLEQKMDALTSAQRKVADYILKNPTEVAFMTIEQLSGLIGVSVASVMRLAYSLGYNGYAQFQKDLQEILRNRVAPPTRLEANVKKMGKSKLLVKCAELQINNIRKTVEFLSDEAIENAFSLISGATRIYVIGVRGSRVVAEYLHQGLNRLGIDCELLLPDSGRLHAVLTKISPTDLVIAISLPRYARRTVEVVRVAKQRGSRVLSIIDGYSSPIALLSDVFLPCAYESLAFQHSEIGAMFVADFLITGMATRNAKQTKLWLDELEKVVSAFDANVIK